LKSDEIKKLLVQLGESHGRDFERLFPDLQKTVLSYDPLILLSILSTYSLFEPTTKKPKADVERRIQQHHVELLQGLILRHRREGFQNQHPTPLQVQALINVLFDTAKAFRMRRYASVDNAMTKEQQHEQRLIEVMRNHT
jgi:hypothetical protein